MRALCFLIFLIFSFKSSFSQKWTHEELKYINSVREEVRITIEDYRMTLNSIAQKQFEFTNTNFYESWRDYAASNGKVINDLSSNSPERWTDYISVSDYLKKFGNTFRPDLKDDQKVVYFNDLIVGKIHNGSEQVIQVVFVQQYLGSNKFNDVRYSSSDRLVTLVIDIKDGKLLTKIRTVEPASKEVRMRIMDEDKIILQNLYLFDKGMKTASNIITEIDSSYFNEVDYRNIFSLRIKAIGVLTDFETALNSLNGDPIEARRVIDQISSFADTSGKIVDDLKPGRSKNKTELLSFHEYLDRFRLSFIHIDSLNGTAIRFSDYLVGKTIHRKEKNIQTDYVPVIFTTQYFGIYKGSSDVYKPTLKYATLKVFYDNENRSSLRIIDIRFPTLEDSLRIVSENREYKLHERFIKDKIKNDLLFDSLFNAGNEAYLNGKYENSIRLFELAIILKPQDQRTKQVVTNLKQIILNRERYNNASHYLQIADSLNRENEFKLAIENYQYVLMYDSTNGYAKNQIKLLQEKGETNFPHVKTGYLAINYNFQYYDIERRKFIQNAKINGAEFNNTLSKFSLSFYYPIGLYFGSIYYLKDPLPTSTHSLSEYKKTESQLVAQGVSIEPLEYEEMGFNLTGFSSGLYLSAFRPIYLKLGITTRRGSIWELYKGDLKGYLNYYNSSQKLYAGEKYNVNYTNLDLGLAFVFPYCQVEITAENKFKEISIFGGVNIPIKDVYILTRNPKKVSRNESVDNSSSNVSNEIKRFPRKTTTYFAMNYNFFETSATRITKQEISEIKINEPALKQFGISIYQRFGFHLSQMQYSKENIPNNIYSNIELAQAKEQLLASGYGEKNLEYLKEGFNGYRFCVGFYVSFFRPIHFLAAVTSVSGETWDIYKGDYTPVLNPSSGTNEYFGNNQKLKETKFTTGIAIVLPGFQTEIIYDGFLQQLTYRAGINIPIVNN